MPLTYDLVWVPVILANASRLKSKCQTITGQHLLITHSRSNEFVLLPACPAALLAFPLQSQASWLSPDPKSLFRFPCVRDIYAERVEITHIHSGILQRQRKMLWHNWCLDFSAP